MNGTCEHHVARIDGTVTDVVVGSVNLRHRRAATDALAQADLGRLHRLITRRVLLERFADALTARPDDIKIVLTLSEQGL